MDDRQKEILMASVTHDELIDVRIKFNRYKINTEDDSFFDYDLLKAALARKHIPISNFLLKVGCRARNPNKIGSEETAFHLALKFGNRSVIKRMLKNGASIYDKDDKGDLPLYATVKKMDSFNTLIMHSNVGAVFNYYISKDLQLSKNRLTALNFNPTNEDDILHFHIACIINKVHAVKLYIKHGFNINRPFGLDSTEFIGFYPLHHAAIRRHIKLFECLLQHGADISIPNGSGLTALHILYYNTIRGSNKDMIRQLFKHGNSTKYINALDDCGISHFHICCTSNSPDHAQVFIDKGVDINSAVPFIVTKFRAAVYPGFTPLHYAILHRQIKVVKLLLENGADCNKKDKVGSTPLHTAFHSFSIRGLRSIIGMLIDYKACTTAVNKEGHTPLHTAFHRGFNCYPKILDMLITKIPQEINFTDNFGISHFHIVCTTNDTSRVEDFLKSGTRIDHCLTMSGDKISGYTALHFAVLYNQKDVVEMLLKWNAQVNIKTELQLTPLHVACDYFHMKYHNMGHDKQDNLYWTSQHKNQLEIIKLLLLHGADVEAQDSLGRTPLLHAHASTSDNVHYVLFGSLDNSDLYKDTVLKEIIQILLTNKANINARTNSQETILHLFSNNHYLMNSEEILEFCINIGANVHATDDTGLTPLHAAVKNLNKMCVQVFLKNKANVNAKSKDCKTPLNLQLKLFIYSSEERDILLLLLENGSDVNNRYGYHRTTWLDAIEYHNDFVLEKLLYYGADINMEDSMGNPLIVFVLNKWQSEILSGTLNNVKSKANILYMILIHLNKLLAIDFHVNEKVLECCLKLKQCFSTVFSNENIRTEYPNINDCIQELEGMKLIKIDNNISLFSILRKSTHEFSKYVRNSKLVKILEEQDIDKEFPLYSFLLKIQFRKGLIRSEVLQSANKSLSYVIGLNLPDLCYDRVLKYLTNEEIANLKAAAPFK